MRTTSFLSILILATAFTILSSCENSDQTAVSSAQACLDKATTKTSADACAAQLASVHTPEAYLVICSAHFVAQGFTTTRFVNAYNALTSSTSGSNPTAESLALMSFDATTGTDGSQQTLTDCQASNEQSLVQLAVLSQMATLVGTVAQSLGSIYDPTVGYTSADLNAALAQLTSSPDPATVAALGSTAITASSAYCSTGSSYATTSVCTTLNASITAGASPASIGAALIAQLQIPQ